MTPGVPLFQAEAALQDGALRHSPTAARSPEAAENAAREFEAMVMAQLLQPMFAGLGTDGLFGGGQGEQMFRSLLIDQFGQEIAKAGGLGIADAVKATLLQIQEV